MSFGVVTSASRPMTDFPLVRTPVIEVTATDRISARVHIALALLTEAYQYARELGQSLWDFAVEIDVMHRAGVTNSDFRWMAYKGMLDHGRETTMIGDANRSFRRGGNLSFNRRSCFVITNSGLGFALDQPTSVELKSPSVEISTGTSVISRHSLNDEVPSWDRDRQELRWGDTVVKQFKVPAPNQELILAAFQEDGWPVRIDDPLPPHPELDPKRRLHDTINSLNRSQKLPLIRFLGDGSGQGVRWCPVDVT